MLPSSRWKCHRALLYVKHTPQGRQVSPQVDRQVSPRHDHQVVLVRLFPVVSQVADQRVNRRFVRLLSLRCSRHRSHRYDPRCSLVEDPAVGQQVNRRADRRRSQVNSHLLSPHVCLVDSPLCSRAANHLFSHQVCLVDSLPCSLHRSRRYVLRRVLVHSLRACQLASLLANLLDRRQCHLLLRRQVPKR